MSMTWKAAAGGALAGTIGRYLVNGKWTAREAAIHIGLFVATTAMAVIALYGWPAFADAPSEVVVSVGVASGYLAPRALQIVAFATIRFRAAGLEVDSDAKPD